VRLHCGRVHVRSDWSGAYGRARCWVRNGWSHRRIRGRRCLRVEETRRCVVRRSLREQVVVGVHAVRAEWSRCALHHGPREFALLQIKFATTGAQKRVSGRKQRTKHATFFSPARARAFVLKGGVHPVCSAARSALSTHDAQETGRQP
jgi:hypothetical protein